MPTLSCFFAIYTDGAPLNDSFEPASADITLIEFKPLVFPSASDELFGPYARTFSTFKPARGWLLSMRREVKGRAGTFFNEARRALLEATRGVTGMGLDVLRLWPFPLDTAEETLPDDLLSEDLFSVGFTEMGEHGYRAETFGLAKLGQREISFEFHGRELVEEAALMCGHLADWLLEHGRRVEDAQSMAFGFDRITFFAPEGAAATGPFHGWHPAIIQKLLPLAVFPGVGVLEVLSHPEGLREGATQDLSLPLRRSLEQRLLLEELDVTGDSPHSQSTARVWGVVHELKNLQMWREEHTGSKDSGWRLRTTGWTAPDSLVTLGELAGSVPDIVRYFALPWGVRLDWNEEGRMNSDISKARHADDDLDDD